VLVFELVGSFALVLLFGRLLEFGLGLMWVLVFVLGFELESLLM
jgi:hypothetical protein